LGLGDPRIRTKELVEPFFKSYFTKVEIKELELDFCGKPLDLLSFFMLTYEVAMLSDEGKEILEERLVELKARRSRGQADTTNS
jgi:hypothetical protein